jgi:hypothetical protein
MGGRGGVQAPFRRTRAGLARRGAAKSSEENNCNAAVYTRFLGGRFFSSF